MPTSRSEVCNLRMKVLCIISSYLGLSTSICSCAYSKPSLALAEPLLRFLGFRLTIGFILQDPCSYSEAIVEI